MVKKDSQFNKTTWSWYWFETDKLQRGQQNIIAHILLVINHKITFNLSINSLFFQKNKYIKIKFRSFRLGLTLKSGDFTYFRWENDSGSKISSYTVNYQG